MAARVWQSPTMAVGVAGRWLPFAALAVLEQKKTLTIRGVVRGCNALGRVGSAAVLSWECSAGSAKPGALRCEAGGSVTRVACAALIADPTAVS